MFSLKNIFPVILSAVLVASCDKTPVKLDDINEFSVKADGTNSTQPANDTAYYGLGSTATFTFTGNPATVSFYSGEVGHRYNYRNRTSAPGVCNLVFKTALNAGSQANSLRVMLSSDFKGVVSNFQVVDGLTTNILVYDSAATLANIAAANWTDITPANLATNSTATTSTIDLSSYAAAGKKVFIAFKYTAQQGSVQNKWTITSLNVSNSLPDGTVYNIANLGANTTPISNYGGTTYSPGWVGYKTATYNWVITSGTSLVITGAATAAAATSNEESWALMGDLDLTTVTPDLAVAINDMTVKPSSYKYTYLSKGVYDAVFAATNRTIYTSDTISRKIPVVVQ